jgi:hypothetical protein
MEKYRQQCAEKGLPTDDETVVLFAMFPQQVEDLHKAKTKPVAAPTSAVPTPAQPAPTVPPGSGSARHLFITVNNRRHDVTVEALD